MFLHVGYQWREINGIMLRRKKDKEEKDIIPPTFDDFSGERNFDTELFTLYEEVIVEIWMKTVRISLTTSFTVSDFYRNLHDGGVDTS